MDSQQNELEVLRWQFLKDRLLEKSKCPYGQSIEELNWLLRFLPQWMCYLLSNPLHTIVFDHYSNRNRSKHILIYSFMLFPIKFYRSELKSELADKIILTLLLENREYRLHQLTCSPKWAEQYKLHWENKTTNSRFNDAPYYKEGASKH